MAGNQNETKNRTVILDTNSPDTVSNLQAPKNGIDWIFWNWTNPPNSDFNHTEVWLNNSWVANTSNNFYNATGLSYNTAYGISLKTVDNVGNINPNSIKNISKTKEDAPPVVSLESPLNNSGTKNSSVIFNCSAADNYSLVNISLYGDFSGGWTLVETRNVSGNSTWSNFTVALSDGNYNWNCRAFDMFNNSAFANSNYTLDKTTSSSSAGGFGGGAPRSSSRDWKMSVNINEEISEEETEDGEKSTEEITESSEEESSEEEITDQNEPPTGLISLSRNESVLAGIAGFVAVFAIYLYSRKEKFLKRFRNFI
ncbi:MAG: hypothetical protein R6U26_02060 [Candidatus Undinarchaeales archaeon]